MKNWLIKKLGGVLLKDHLYWLDVMRSNHAGRTAHIEADRDEWIQKFTLLEDDLLAAEHRERVTRDAHMTLLSEYARIKIERAVVCPQE